MRPSALVAGALLIAAAPLAGQAGEDTPPRLTVSGFVSTTLYAQDRAFGFGDGQSAVWAAPGRGDDDRWFTGGDVRNTRLRLTLDQDAGDRTTVQGVVEIDFFGAFNGTGPFSSDQPQPRLRLAYVDLQAGRNLVRFGQMFTPLMGAVPVSLSHIAFPIGLASGGVIGWRHPGVLVSRQLLTGGQTTVAVQGGAFRGSWTPVSRPDGQPAQAASMPQLEARLDVRHTPATGAAWSAYLVGHYDTKNVDVALADSTVARDLEGLGLQAGGSLSAGAFSLRGNAYLGRALGQQFGQLGQFGDIAGWGAWIQPGLRLSQHFDAFVFAGRDDPDDADVIRDVAGTRRLDNRTAAGMIRYSLGDYAVSLEALHVRTRWYDTGLDGADRWDVSARQISVSMLYAF